MKTMIIAPTIILLFFVCCNEDASRSGLVQARQDTMKANFMSLMDDGWNHGDMEKLKTVSVQNYIRKLNGITVATHRNEMEANMNIFLKGFPDRKVTVDHIILKDDQLVAHWTFTGTNTGIFGESPPTGKKVAVSGCSTMQFNEGGKITKEETYYNELELLQQLGYSLIPPVLE